MSGAFKKEGSISVCHFANTFVGKKGNIGIRTAHLLRYSADDEFALACFARGYSGHYQGVHCNGMSLFGQIPRILNAVRIYACPSYNHRYFDIRLFETLGISCAKKMLEAGMIDLAHVWDYCPSLIGFLKAKGVKTVLDVPIAPTTYGRRINSLVTPGLLMDDSDMIAIEAAAFSAADHILAPSAFVADELVLAGVEPSKISVVAFGVDHIKGHAPVRTFAAEKSGLDYCLAGALGRRKGVFELLDAWGDPQFSGDRLHLCGRVYPDVKRKISSLGLKNVILPGFVDLREYFSKCDVFVLPSWLEGSAKVVYEAMSMGLPCIVTNSTGSIVRHRTDGLVIKPGDVEELKSCMIWMKNNPLKARDMGLSARGFVSGYTWNHYASRVYQVYRDVLK